MNILECYNKEIRSKINELESKSLSPNTRIEVETRFKDVTFNILERVRADLMLKCKCKMKEIHSTDYYSSNIRKTLTVIPIVSSDRDASIGINYQPITLIKRPYWSIDLNSYPISVVISTETKVISKQSKESSKVFIKRFDSIRAKHRWELTAYNGIISIDFTQITETRKGSRPLTRYEIGAVINGSVNLISLRCLGIISTYIMQLIFNTNKIYTIQDRSCIVDTFNYLTQDICMNVMTLYQNPVVKARNLKRDDCVWGGLLGGEVNYIVTPTIKGKQKLLIIHKTGVWFVSPPLEINRLTSDSPGKEYEGTILDGTYSPLQSCYLPFDVIAYKGDNMQNKPLFNRLEICDRLIYVLQEFLANELTINFKPYIPIGTTMRHLHIALDRISDMTASLPYKTNGLAFVPTEVGYVSSTEVGDEHLHNCDNDRVLTKFPDICKIKLWEHITIDLRVDWVLGRDVPAKLLVYNSDNKCLIPFVGTYLYPLNLVTQVDWSHPIINSIPSGTIVEFSPQLRKGIIILQPCAIRKDKTYPDNKSLAESLWEDINKPLTLECLSDENTLSLAHYYHDRIRTHLHTLIPQGVHIYKGDEKKTPMCLLLFDIFIDPKTQIDSFKSNGGGRVLFLMLDIDAVKLLVSKLGRRFTLGKSNFEFHSDTGKLEIDDKSTYPVCMRNLGFNNLNVFAATDEQFLFDPAKDYTSMFVYGCGTIS